VLGRGVAAVGISAPSAHGAGKNRFDVWFGLLLRSRLRRRFPRKIPQTRARESKYQRVCPGLLLVGYWWLP